MEAEKQKAKRLSKEERVAKLKEKQKQIAARIAKIEASDKAKERKEDTRRKVMFGGFVLSLLGKNESANAMFEQFLASLKKEPDKALFEGYKK